MGSRPSGHDLPLALRLDPGNGNDFTASLRTVDRLRKLVASKNLGWGFEHFIADAGHDAEAIHNYLVDRGIKRIIPLKRRRY